MRFRISAWKYFLSGMMLCLVLGTGVTAQAAENVTTGNEATVPETPEEPGTSETPLEPTPSEPGTPEAPLEPEKPAEPESPPVPELPLTVTFYSKDGSSVVGTVPVVRGRVKLPTMRNAENATFMGWSKHSGGSVRPQFQPGDVITVPRSSELYAVMYSKKKETNLKASSLPKLDTRKYSKIIFVGDSRTNMLKNLLHKEMRSSQLQQLSFVCRSGQGLDWFKEKGLPQLKREIYQARKQDPGKKVAVVFNLGVNDLRHRSSQKTDCTKVASRYVKYMNNLGKTLTKSGCSLYYMSVNPVNDEMSYTYRLRRTEEIRYMNDVLKKGLDGNFTFLDCYNYLMETGYTTGKSYLNPEYRDDGVHYTPMTYKRIFRYCMNKVNKG